MNISFAHFTIAALAAAWAGGVHAASGTEEEALALAYGDKSSVSIATGSQQPINRAPAVATVITAEDIAAIGATNLDGVLETVPGLHVSRASIRYSPLYVIRGIGGGNQTNPQVLMLQNGIPMTTMYNGDRGSAWIGLPVENIARIEIIRGPGSALYGADAYAGVINIITKTSTDTPGTEAGMRAGSFNTWDTWVQHGGKWGEADMAAYLRIGSTNGIRKIINADAQTRNDSRFGTRVSLAPGPVNTGYDAVDANLDLAHGKWRMRAGYKLRDDLQTGAGVSSALDPNSMGRAENVSGDLSWNDPQFAQNWSVGATVSMLYYTFTYPTNLQLLPPGARLGATAFPNGLIGGPNQWEKQFRFSGNATYSGFDDHKLRLGAGHEGLDLYRTKTIKNYTLNAKGTPANPGEVLDYTNTQPHILPQRRKIDYFYAQDEWNFTNDWTLTAGIRRDSYSDVGGTTNPRLALVWDAAYDLTAKLLYGQAFRAPSFVEQYGINPVANGNPDLKPETIRTLEAAFSWQPRRDTQLNLSLFRYQMEDVIRLVGTSYANTGAQHGSGMELESVWDVIRTLRLTGNYSYQKSIDEATGQDAGYAPHHLIYARADWSVGGTWQLSSQVNWVADRKRAAGDTRPSVPDYTTVDLTARSKRGKNRLEYAISVRNLFNADVREPSLPSVNNPAAIPNDLPMAPRWIYLQAIYNL